MGVMNQLNYRLGAPHWVDVQRNVTGKSWWQPYCQPGLIKIRGRSSGHPPNPAQKMNTHWDFGFPLILAMAKIKLHDSFISYPSPVTLMFEAILIHKSPETVCSSANLPCSVGSQKKCATKECGTPGGKSQLCMTYWVMPPRFTLA